MRYGIRIYLLMETRHNYEVRNGTSIELIVNVTARTNCTKIRPLH